MSFLWIDKHVISLWNLGLHTSCPRVKTLELYYQKEENVSSEIVTMACSPFHHLTHLHVKGALSFPSSTVLNDPVSFCDAVKTSCPQLIKLSLILHFTEEREGSRDPPTHEDSSTPDKHRGESHLIYQGNDCHSIIKILIVFIVEHISGLPFNVSFFSSFATPISLSLSLACPPPPHPLPHFSLCPSHLIIFLSLF